MHLRKNLKKLENLEKAEKDRKSLVMFVA